MSEDGPVPAVPFALLASDSAEYKRRFKIVRRDSLADVAGEIIAADEATGECALQVAGESKTLNFGAGGLKIVARGRA